MAESTTGKPKQLTCHCVAPANPLKNNNSLQIKLSSSLSVTGFQVRKLVLWVHSLTLNTCLNKLLHPMASHPVAPMDKSAELLARMLALISHLFPSMCSVFSRKNQPPRSKPNCAQVFPDSPGYSIRHHFYISSRSTRDNMGRPELCRNT